MVIHEALDRIERHEALLMLEKIIGWDRAKILANRDHPLPKEQEEVYEDWIRQRSLGRPLQYILGEWDFYSITLLVREGVLIPRPETELLVEAACQQLPKGASVIDIGTGSGAIALALASERPDITVTGTDISTEALALALENREHLGISNVSFVESDLFDRLPLEKVTAVISNPPYIRLGDAATLAVELSHEPTLALFGGADGLVYYRKIIAQAKDYLVPGGFLMLEMGYDQKEDIFEMLKENGYTHWTGYRDYQDFDRFVIARL